MLELIEEQSKRMEQRIDALLLVGGFAGSEYLFKKVEVCRLVESLIGNTNCPRPGDVTCNRTVARYDIDGYWRAWQIGTVLE